MMKTDHSYIQKVFSLLDCFSFEKPQLGVREAARMLEISHSSAGRLMSELRDEGVLLQNPETKSYALGGRVIRWAEIYTASSDLRMKALPYLKKIFEETNETISLYAAEEFDRVCVERLESRQTVRIVEMVGTRIHVYAGSGGKAILAYRSDAEIDRVLAHAQEFDSLMSEAEIIRLRQELSEIRRTGISISHGEWHIEASGIAAPIFNQRQVPIGAISISGPSQRFQDVEKMNRYGKLLLDNTKQISYELGCLSAAVPFDEKNQG